jgi:hypothetical protein
MEKTWFRFTLILFFVSLLTSFAITTVQAKIYEREFRTIKSNYPNTLVFNFEIETSTGYEFLSCDEFVLYEEIDNHIFTILSLPGNVSLSSVRTTLTSPSGKEFQNTIERQKWFNEKNSPIRLSVYNFPLEFNESGIWYLEFYFTTSEKVWPWEFIGYIWDFDDYSTIRTTYAYERHNYYKKGVTVFSLSELVQLRAAKAAEETAEKYEFSLWFLGAAALGSLIAAAASAWHLRELVKRKKEESIIHLIEEAITPAISEFKTLKDKLSKIRSRHIIPLPSFISDSELSESQWTDYRREIFTLNLRMIRQYLKKKNRYAGLRKEALSLIKDELKKLDLKEFENDIIQLMKKRKMKTTLELFFNKKLLNDLALIILHFYYSENQIANDFFKKHKDMLLEIRNEPKIKEKINEAVQYAEKMKKYEKRHNKLRYNHRDFLMKKYNITDWDIEKFSKAK